MHGVPRSWLLLAGLALAIGCEGGRPQGDAAASGDELARVAASKSGRYRIGVRPADPSAVRSELHDWVVRIERTDGEPARPSTVHFDGGMPSHGHGFTTTPQVTQQLAGGEFLVEGVKFHMAGPWQLRVSVSDAEGVDGASFEISVAP